MIVPSKALIIAQDIVFLANAKLIRQKNLPVYKSIGKYPVLPEIPAFF